MVVHKQSETPSPEMRAGACCALTMLKPDLFLRTSILEKRVL